MIIDGKKESGIILDKIKNSILSFNTKPALAVVIIGDDPASQVYVKNKILACEKVGIKSSKYAFDSISETELVEFIEKKKKVKVKASSIKEQLMLFVNCVIENPSFDSQTKDYMNTPVAKFGSSCTVSDKFIENICKMECSQYERLLHHVWYCQEHECHQHQHRYQLSY